MNKYSFVIWSFKPQKTEMFDNLLNNKVIAPLVFPAKMFIGENKTEAIYFSNSGEFSSSLIPRENYSIETGRISLYLYPDNGLEFYAAALPSSKIAPSVITLDFTTKHIQQESITLDDMIMLIRESIPDFEIGQACLYDSHQIRIPEPTGGYRILKPTTYKRPAGGHYRLEMDWLTYFGKDYLELIGRKRFDELKTCYLKEEVNNGILVVLQEEPFDNSNPKHVERKKQAERELRFEELLEN